MPPDGPRGLSLRHLNEYYTVAVYFVKLAHYSLSLIFILASCMFDIVLITQ